MTAIESSWLVGAATLDSDATIVVGGNNVVISADTKYLRDATAGNSWIDAIQTGIAGVHAGSTVTVLQNRKVKIDLNGNSATLTIPSALQEWLGFTGSPYSAATSFTAENVSTLLWSPGWPETTIGHPVGTEGYEAPNWVQTSSASGQTIRTTQHGTSAKLTELMWAQVKRARVWTTDGGEPGEFERFRIDVLAPGYRWKLYSGITEDESSSSAVSWTTAVGPYVIRDPEWKWWNRAVANADTHTDITFKGTLTAELS